ncbi:hypothetical protein ACEWY4_016170 [Coilia grayii]|uniref:NACHT domain-containing protein n=1 Tax=Coilia grayii TaxID=363190 RepID=A0ABD1JJT1_9TELE
MAAAPLRPYLCGITEDLPEEWAYLRRQVFPHLDQLCRARGTRFSPVSVCWLNAKDEPPAALQSQSTHTTTSPTPPLTHQQLKIRLDIVDQSDFFMCVLGHRYGSCLSQQAFTPVSSSTAASQGKEQVEGDTSWEDQGGLEGSLCVAGRRGGYPWVLEERHATSSLTELEITQACQSPQAHCLFYFRDYSCQGSLHKSTPTPSENEESAESEGGGSHRWANLRGVWSSVTPQEREKMRQLKKRIVGACWPVRFFRSVEELGELVRRDWEAIIEQLYPTLDNHPGHSSKDPQDILERWQHECHFLSLSKHFLSTPEAEAVNDTINTFVSPIISLAIQERKGGCGGPEVLQSGKTTTLTDSSQSEKSILLVAGERGCGKSALVAHWLQGCRRRHPEVLVVSRVCGLSVGTRDVCSLLRSIVRELRQADGCLPEWAECLDEWQEPWPILRLTQALAAAAALKPTLLLLDGLDMLTASHTLSAQAVKEMMWLPVSLPPQCKLIVTTTSSDLTYKSLIGRSDIRIITWAGLTADPALRRDVLLHHLSLPAREPAAPLVQGIVGRRSSLGHLPLFWAVLGGELRTTGVQRGVQEEEVLEDYAEADSIMQLWTRVIRRWITDYDHNPPEGGTAVTSSFNNTTESSPQVCSTGLRGWVWDCLCLLHLSRSGLTEQQLRALLEVLGHSGSLRVLPLRWAQFRSATGLWIGENMAGQLIFTHQVLECLSLSVTQTPLCPLSHQLRVDTLRYWTLLTSRGYDPTTSCLRPTLLTPRGYDLTTSCPTLKGYNPTTSCSCPTLLTSRGYNPTTSCSCPTQLPPKGYDPTTLCPTLLTPRGNDPTTSCSCPTLLTQGHMTHALHQSQSWSHPHVLPADGARQSCDTVAMGDAEHCTFITETQTGGCLGEEGDSQEVVVRGRVLVFLSELLMSMGHIEEAERGLLEAERLLVEAAGAHTDAAGRLLLRVQHTLAKLYSHTHQHQSAETYCTRALDTTHTLGSSEDASQCADSRVQLLCLLAALQLKTGCLNEVADTLSSITAVNHPKAHPPAVATVTLLQALHRAGVGEHRGAECGLRVVLATRRRWYGPQHPLVAEVEERLADLLTQTHRKHGEAIELYQHVISIREQESRMPLQVTSTLVCNLALALLKLGCCSPVDVSLALQL